MTFARRLLCGRCIGQRAAGENGIGLTGTQREDCFWFSTQPAGPYVVLSDVTTAQLRGRSGMSGWTARRYFNDVPPQSRTYLRGIGADIDYPVHRYFLWAKHLELTLGGATQQLLRLGDILAG